MIRLKLLVLSFVLVFMALDSTHTFQPIEEEPWFVYSPGDGRRAWRSSRGTTAPITVTGVSLWCPIPGVLSDWWLIPRLLTEALGAPVLAHNESDIYAQPADVFLIGSYADQWGAVEDSLAERNSSLSVFLASEAHETFGDGLVDFVDVSLAPRRDLEHLPQYTSFPLFILTLVDKAVALNDSSATSQPTLLCPIHKFLVEGGLQDAAAWRARQNFSLLLTTHMPHPRWLMYYQLNAAAATAAAITAGEGGGGDTLASPQPPPPRVDHPGPMADLRTFWWPPGIPNTRAGKVILLGRYRYSLCPENKLMAGYVTEKLVEAHLAGAVPVYYGDMGAFPEVFNPLRVLQLAPWDTNGTALAAAVVALETNASAAQEFFARPVLAPGAQAWVEGQCQRVVRSMDAGMARLIARQQEVKVRSGVVEGWSLAGRRRGGRRVGGKQQQQQGRRRRRRGQKHPGQDGVKAVGLGTHWGGLNGHQGLGQWWWEWLSSLLESQDQQQLRERLASTSNPFNCTLDGCSSPRLSDCDSTTIRIRGSDPEKSLTQYCTAVRDIDVFS